jgi:hypothetical protein
MIYNSKPAAQKTGGTGYILEQLRGGALSSRCLLRRVSSSSNQPKIYTMSSCQKPPLEALMSYFQSLCKRSYWSNIDPNCRVRARCYPMRIKPCFQYSLHLGPTLSPHQDISSTYFTDNLLPLTIGEYHQTEFCPKQL